MMRRLPLLHLSSSVIFYMSVILILLVIFELHTSGQERRRFRACVTIELKWNRSEAADKATRVYFIPPLFQHLCGLPWYLYSLHLFLHFTDVFPACHQSPFIHDTNMTFPSQLLPNHMHIPLSFRIVCTCLRIASCSCTREAICIVTDFHCYAYSVCTFIRLSVSILLIKYPCTSSLLSGDRCG